MIRVSNIKKTYEGSSTASVKGVSLSIETGSFFTLLGPSGCGKTTLLRCIAGLEQPDSGEIQLGDEIVYSDEARVNTPSFRRPIGMVFQSYAIWPHMTALRNVEYPLRQVPRARRMPRTEMRKAALEALRLVGMDRHAGRFATMLSGGEQQRVALARAIVQNPEVLLLDEPLSNLDAKLRDHMRLELQDLQSRLGLTTIYVTHDQQEAYSLSDRVALMQSGELRELGTPIDLYRAPSSSFGAEFLGSSSRIEGTVVSVGEGWAQVESALGTIACRSPRRVTSGDPVWVYIRPDEVRPRSGGTQSLDDDVALASVTGTVSRIVFLGHESEWFLDVEGTVLRGRVPSFGRHASLLADRLHGNVTVAIDDALCLSRTT